MKIILADPPKKEEKYDLSYPNLGILYLIGNLRKQFQQEDVRIFYLQGHCNLEEHIEAVRKFKPDIYGISFATLTSRLSYKTINALRQEYPDLPIICGGAHPTAAPEDVFGKSDADICVLGEGEKTMREIVEYYMYKNRPLHEIKGIASKESGKVIQTEKRPFIKNIDTIAFPAWDTVDFNNYLGMHLRKGDPQTYMLVSRGCPYNCNFCSNPIWKYNKPWVRMRSAQNIVEEAKILYDRGIREIYMSADEFNITTEWAIEVCKEIEKLGYKDLYFQCNVRADKITEEMVEAFKRINLWMVHLGIESGNQRTLDGIGKRITLEQVNQACKIFKKAGLKVFGFMMLYHAWEEDGNLCWETVEDVDNTLKYCEWLFKENLIDYMSWQPTTPLPGSRLWETAKKFDILPEHEIVDVRRANLKLPNVSPKDVAKSMRKGVRMKAWHMLKSGNIHWGHTDRIIANLKVLLGYGSKA